jgi:hypothetical protein
VNDLDSRPPSWMDDVYRLLLRLLAANVHIRALRLTADQKYDLLEHTGQDHAFYGYPVTLRET